MARILFVVPPLTGHINPAASVAVELAARGHHVAWAAHVELVGAQLPAGHTVFPLALDESFMREASEQSQAMRGLESIRFLYQDFCLPLARHSLPSLEAIAREFQPDLIACDHQMIAGAMVARRLGIDWFSLITTTASMLRMSPLVDDWVAAQLAELQRDYPSGEPVERPDFSPIGSLVFSSPLLVGEQFPRFESRYHFVGPALSGRAAQVEFPWQWLEAGTRKLLVSMGTVSRDRNPRFFEVMMDAVAELPLQVVMVAPEALQARAPDNVLVLPRVPQVALLPHMSAVVCHAGHNTVCEALYHDLPLIVAPIRDDQPVIARQVTDAGAGLALRFGKVSAASARVAVERVLGEPAFRENAHRLGESLRALGGAAQAADVLEQQLAGG